jgi:hypothetical protein
MKRRKLALMAGASAVALNIRISKARAAADPSLLTTTLTPLGSERAGNADGSIPAWTGGYTTLPSGWQPGQSMPDFFADDQPVVVIDSSNMAEHADRLSEGTMAMMKKYGFSIKVYPTHRTACAPQWVYDNIAKNATAAQPVAKGITWGFTNAYGGIPFPIPDTSDPLMAGAQIIWNHNARWWGYSFESTPYSIVVNNGAPVVSAYSQTQYTFPYYDQGGSLATYSGLISKQIAMQLAPANIRGQQIDSWIYSDPSQHPEDVWEVLQGQGRIRKAPEVSYDTPSQFLDGVTNYDEYYGFNNSLQKYQWKYITKKEMYIPYNNNALANAPYQQALLPHFVNPDLVRWELHRVWVVEATLAPGERNVLARRMLYVDEDTYTCAFVDAWDANDNLFHVNHVYQWVRPDAPGSMYFNNAIFNLQTDDYAVASGPFNEQAHPSVYFDKHFPETDFNPEVMTANAQY